MGSVPAGTSMAVVPGTLFGGRYRVEAPVGSGGMGEVYRATDLQTDRPVALKVLREMLHGAGLDRFQREADLVKNLTHPNTVRLFDFGLSTTGAPFIVYELLAGETLAHVLRRGPLPPDRAVRILTQLLRALSEAHDSGIVHRDVKSSNVMIVQYSGDADVVKLLDFGVAKALDRTGLTQTGDVVGTPRAMSPEQLRGEQVTPASDVYAVGLLAIEMSTGRSMYSGNPHDFLSAHLHRGPVALPPELATSALGPVVTKALEADPAKRPQNAHELLVEIERANRGGGKRGARKRSRAWLFAIAAVALLGALGATGMILRASLAEDGRVSGGVPSPSPVAAPPPASGDAADPACALAGCLRAVTHVGDYDRASLEQTLTPGARIDNGYSVLTIDFLTSGAESRATVTVPFGTVVPAGGWHVVANAHGTTGLGDPCAVAGTILGAGLSGTHGARGLIGVAVDYPGLGKPGVHPYLVAESEGRAVLDALRATRDLARRRGIPLSSRFAVTGLSQGGHAVLAAAAQHGAYARDLDIRAFAAVAPASVFEEHWRAGISLDGPHLAVYAMLVHAWSHHYKHTSPTPWAPALVPHIDAMMEESCVYSATGAPSLGGRLGRSPGGIFSTDFITAMKTGRWGAYRAIGDGFAKNRIKPFAQTAPLKIYQGDKDDVVPEVATRQLVQVLKGARMDVDYEVVKGGTHTNVAFGAVAYPELRTDAARSWLLSLLSR